MDIRKLVGWNLRHLRVAKGLPQDDLAADANLDRAHVSRIERGVENPTIQILDRLAKALGINPRDFFDTVPPGVTTKTLKRGPKTRTQSKRKKIVARG